MVNYNRLVANLVILHNVNTMTKVIKLFFVAAFP